MGIIKEAAEKFWNGEITVAQQHPLIPTGEYEEVAAGVMFYRWFANFVAVKTEEGIVLVDTGAHFNQAETVALVRRFGPERINTAIYTHGHVDHALGMAAFIAEGQKNKVARARVVGHRTIAARFWNTSPTNRTRACAISARRSIRIARFILSSVSWNGPPGWPRP